MCNGLNYTKLNRRLTDIKSDWEKLVGKCILLPAHQHQHHLHLRHDEPTLHYHQHPINTPAYSESRIILSLPAAAAAGTVKSPSAAVASFNIPRAKLPPTHI